MQKVVTVTADVVERGPQLLMEVEVGAVLVSMPLLIWLVPTCCDTLWPMRSISDASSMHFCTRNRPRLWPQQYGGKGRFSKPRGLYDVRVPYLHVPNALIRQILEMLKKRFRNPTLEIIKLRKEGKLAYQVRRW